MSSQTGPILIGAGALGLLALASGRSSSSNPRSGPVTEVEPPTNPGGKVTDTWARFIVDYQKKNGREPSARDMVRWDQQMIKGCLPPGYFFDCEGKVIGRDQVVMHRNIDPFDPMPYEEAIEHSFALYQQQLENQPVFYVNTLHVHAQSPGEPAKWKAVRFYPPTKVRLLPTSADDLQGLSNSPGGAFDFIVPRWTVEMLERRREVVDDPTIDLDYRVWIEPFQIFLE